MQVAHSTDIGLRALIVLAGSGDNQTTVAKLADQLEVPVRYLGKITQRMSAVGWVATTRGRSGGLHASPAGRQATVADVIGLFEPHRVAINCREPLCPLIQHCKLQSVLVDADHRFLTEMATVHVSDLV